ncbi:MAG: four helix bundle suffix domain-containing protein [Candidatus Moranbacteria bacterium]|nr:four helix bundle suffix domain-containing protein [Candidatus Moranbacteria bacterium]
MQDQKSKAGFEYLLAYKITVPIYDLTVEFTEKHISKFSRTVDQMVQAARSGMQNILEGNKQQSLAGYIKLCGVARGSLEELLKDYYAFARQNKIRILDKSQAALEIKEIEEIWGILRNNPTLPNSPDFPNLPDDKEKAANMMITLVNQANYLLDKLIVSLKEKHMKEGGFNEKLYRDRIDYRKNNRY